MSEQQEPKPRRNPIGWLLSIGAVVALLMWFYLAAFSVMLGAIFNVELRRRRRVAAAREARKSLRDQVRQPG